MLPRLHFSIDRATLLQQVQKEATDVVNGAYRHILTPLASQYRFGAASYSSTTLLRQPGIFSPFIMNGGAHFASRAYGKKRAYLEQHPELCLCLEDLSATNAVEVPVGNPVAEIINNVLMSKESRGLSEVDASMGRSECELGSRSVRSSRALQHTSRETANHGIVGKNVQRADRDLPPSSPRRTKSVGLRSHQLCPANFECLGHHQRATLTYP